MPLGAADRARLPSGLQSQYVSKQATTIITLDGPGISIHVGEISDATRRTMSKAQWNALLGSLVAKARDMIAAVDLLKVKHSWLTNDPPDRRGYTPIPATDGPQLAYGETRSSFRIDDKVRMRKLIWEGIGAGMPVAVGKEPDEALSRYGTVRDVKRASDSRQDKIIVGFRSRAVQEMPPTALELYDWDDDALDNDYNDGMSTEVKELPKVSRFAATDEGFKQRVRGKK